MEPGKGGPSEKGFHRVEAYLRCAKEYQLASVRNIYVPSNNTPDALAVGTFFHAGRARWFASNFGTDAATWEKVRAAVQDAHEELEKPATPEAEQKALAILQAYIEHWSKKPLPRPIAAEYEIRGKLGEEDTSERTAKLDDVSEYPNVGLCLGEGKSTSVGVADALKQYELHGQPMLQMALWKVSPDGEAKHGPVRGVMLDVVRKPYAKTKAAFDRVFIPITDFALDWYIKNLRKKLTAAAELMWNSEAERNITACTRQYGRMRADCGFKNLCRYGRSASGDYVMGPEGASLLSWRPSEDRAVPPWA